MITGPPIAGEAAEPLGGSNRSLLELIGHSGYTAGPSIRHCQKQAVAASSRYLQVLTMRLSM